MMSRLTPNSGLLLSCLDERVGRQYLTLSLSVKSKGEYPRSDVSVGGGPAALR